MRVGDKVGIISGFSYRSYSTSIIKGETKLYWIVANSKFRKDNLQQVGLGKWDSCEICEITEQFEKTYLEYKLRNWDIQKHYQNLSLINRCKVFKFFQDNNLLTKKEN